MSAAGRSACGESKMMRKEGEKEKDLERKSVDDLDSAGNKHALHEFTATLIRLPHCWRKILKASPELQSTDYRTIKNSAETCTGQLLYPNLE